jgi:hypothetical protein
MTSDNLPILVSDIGGVPVSGALQKVVSNLEPYTDERYPLDITGQMMLARLVETRPKLNVESRVALLVDAIAYHGVDQGEAFNSLIDRFGIEDVYLALDYLHEVGTRGRGTTDGANEDDRRRNSMSNVEQVVELIVRFRAFDIDISTVESLYKIIYKLGGIKSASEADDETVESALPAHN